MRTLSGRAHARWGKSIPYRFYHRTRCEYENREYPEFRSQSMANNNKLEFRLVERQKFHLHVCGTGNQVSIVII